MKISRVRIRNFRSLKDVYLDKIGSMIFLVGKNSSGKSNFLEALALFFNEFNLIEAGPAAGSASGLDHYLWFDGDTSKPIEITLTIELDDEECDELFPTEALSATKQKYTENYNQLTICRRIVDLKIGRRTEFVKWADLFLVRDNRLVSPEDFGKSISLAIVTETSSSSHPPNSAAAKMLGRIASGIQEKIRDRFLLARVMRDATERPTNLLTREPIIDSETRNALVALGQSRGRREVKKWARFERIFEDFSSMRLDVREGEIFAKRDDMYLPMYLAGGGDQEILTIMNSLLEEAPLFGIEEAEMHLHPRLVKRIFTLLKDASSDTQVFVATHSPTLIDLIDLDEVVMMKIEANQTKVRRLSERGELRNLFWELEVEPSDVLFAERILLVPGEPQKVAVLAWAQKLGVNPDPITILSVGTGGKDRYLLKTWLKVAERAGIPIFLLLGRGAKDEVAELIDEGLISQRCCLILSGEVEDLYPIETVVKVLNEEYELGLTDKSIDARKARKYEIERILSLKKKLHPGWKVAVASRVAKMMSADLIPVEVRVLFENVLRQME